MTPLCNQAFKGADPETKKAGYPLNSALDARLHRRLWRVSSCPDAWGRDVGGTGHYSKQPLAILTPTMTMSWTPRQRASSGGYAKTLMTNGLLRSSPEGSASGLGLGLLPEARPSGLVHAVQQQVRADGPVARWRVAVRSPADVLGPTGTMVGNVGNVADFVERGNLYRAAEYAMPKGSALLLRNYAVRAGRLQNTIRPCRSLTPQILIS